MVVLSVLVIHSFYYFYGYPDPYQSNPYRQNENLPQDRDLEISKNASQENNANQDQHPPDSWNAQQQPENADANQNGDKSNENEANENTNKDQEENEKKANEWAIHPVWMKTLLKS